MRALHARAGLSSPERRPDDSKNRFGVQADSTDAVQGVSRRWTPAIVPAHIPVLLAWLGLVLSLLHLFWSLGNASPAVLENSKWITSDSLYPVNVTTDILRDGYPLSGWRFSVAPHWFPDLFTTGLFWAITRNPVTATLLAGFIQLALIVGAFQLMRKAIGLGSGRLQMIMLLGISIWLTLYTAAHLALAYPDFYRFFIPQSHVGGLIMSLYALALGLLLLDQAQKGADISRGPLIPVANGLTQTRC